LKMVEVMKSNYPCLVSPMKGNEDESLLLSDATTQISPGSRPV
jgi:hypothetical protein